MLVIRKCLKCKQPFDALLGSHDILCDACVAAKLTDSWYDEEYENAEYKKFKSEADEDIFEREAILDIGNIPTVLIPEGQTYESFMKSNVPRSKKSKETQPQTKQKAKTQKSKEKIVYRRQDVNPYVPITKDNCEAVKQAENSQDKIENDSRVGIDEQMNSQGKESSGTEEALRGLLKDGFDDLITSQIESNWK